MDKKNQILEAADILFAEEGYNLSMSEIAKEVGIKVPSIYSHYSGKDEIIFIIVKNEIFGFYLQTIEELKKQMEKSWEESLRELYYHILNYYSQENRLRFWRNISLIQNQKLKKDCVDFMKEQEKCLSTKLEEVFRKGIAEESVRGEDEKKMATFYMVLIRGVMDRMIVYQNSETDLEIFLHEIWDEYSFLKKK